MADDFKATAERAVKDTRKTLKALQRSLLTVVRTAKQDGKFTVKRVKATVKMIEASVSKAGEIAKLTRDKAFEKLQAEIKTQVEALVKLVRELEGITESVSRVIKMLRLTPEKAFKQIAKFTKSLAREIGDAPKHVMELVRASKKGLQQGAESAIEITLLPALFMFSQMVEAIDAGLV